MIYSAKIGYGISLLGEAILREGFFDGGEAVPPRKPKCPWRMTGLSESYRQKKLLLRGARENNAATLRELYARLRSA